MSNNKETKEKVIDAVAPVEEAIKPASSSKAGKAVRTAVSVVAIILCVALLFLLICNIIIIVKGSSDSQKPPSVFGVTPMIVLTNSMSGNAADHVEQDDLIFVDNTAPEKLQIGDVVSFMEGKIVVTHRIVDITYDENNVRQFTTAGDNNFNTDGTIAIDTETRKDDDVIGKVRFRVPYVGAVVFFMSKPLGMICFIGIPLLAFIIYDIIRRQRAATKENKKTDALEAELARLRALAGEGANDTGADNNQAPKEEVSEEK